MIDYKGKGQMLGLANALANAGIVVSVVDGDIVCSNALEAQTIIDAWTADDEAAWARTRIPPVTRRQMLTALHRAGLLATIQAAVAASGDVELQIAYDESQEFQRSNPFLAAMAQALGKTDAEIDAVFALAATL